MVNPEQFQARAEECDAKAETAPDPDLRLLYRDLAAQWRDLEAQWRKLAQQREKLDVDAQRLTWPRRAAPKDTP
jgi:hypothetical protein